MKRTTILTFIAIYMVLITVLSLQTHSGILRHLGIGSSKYLSYDAMHLPGYGLLTYMLLMVFRNSMPGAYFLSFCITLMFGVGNEYLQSFVPGRSMQTGDIVRDIAGCVIAFAVFALVSKVKGKYKTIDYRPETMGRVHSPQSTVHGC